MFVRLDEIDGRVRRAEQDLLSIKSRSNDLLTLMFLLFSIRIPLQNQQDEVLLRFTRSSTFDSFQWCKLFCTWQMLSGAATLVVHEEVVVAEFQGRATAFSCHRTARHDDLRPPSICSSQDQGRDSPTSDLL